MNLSILNTFSDQAFRGNPAAVCLLSEEKGSSWMQSIAKEMNLPVTAFINEFKSDYYLRWFTPSTEIPICGHGTLASSFFLWENGYVENEKVIAFQTKSGLLKAQFIDGWVQLEFPSNLEEKTIAPDLLISALGVEPTYVGKNKLDYLVEVESEDTVKNLIPNIDLISQLPVRGVIVTSKSNSNEYDFVSRFFSPAQGIIEDYVNGSSHCCLGPYWKNKLHKTDFIAYQASERGGILKVKLLGDKVLLSGKAVTIFEGKLTV
ncbi:PhzF family phenazine biosynthesis protein [Metabacillus sediminilitoris]|uniref:PhzF family phenazine biosynthesis protein n=1 Tax=Metabacillus sediminilitoris TaxID=2567941 RepID=A0A4S4BJS4_9BACI|nr:PhzF family phenazine biosynthesis protein [Metabacillus sediminilitoris]QGQ45801.1 PhzF family phenazine biosynthesis isomerase [Metabacillus sediminilitoris]THF73975.1 PhzF family phenazine biosynthesis protein [Metabacillus sediminilitoris]